jgi:polyhydroxybutyrate depolymerase
MRLRPPGRAAPAAALLVAAAALGVAGLGGVASAPARAPVDAAAACAIAPGTTARVSVAVPGGGPRSALVHMPRRRLGGPMPLVIALHGAYGSGAFMEPYSGLSRLADRKGFAVAYPDAAGSFWRIRAQEGDADVRFLDALIDRVVAGGCFDERRVSAVGVSNGGGMAARFACAGHDRLAGVVAVAGGYGALPACQARRPLSVLEIHGTADRVVPYDGDPEDGRGAVRPWLRAWAALDGCAPGPRRTRERPGVVRLDWRRCRDGAAVSHLRLVGGTHAWPGADPPDPGPRFGISAAQEAWRFLRPRRR